MIADNLFRCAAVRDLGEHPFQPSKNFDRRAALEFTTVAPHDAKRVLAVIIFSHGI